MIIKILFVILHIHTASQAKTNGKDYLNYFRNCLILLTTILKILFIDF